MVKTEDELDNHPNLDLTTATTIIQQQQEQISALLQQQQQLQTQATSLLAPALSNVLGQQQPPGTIRTRENGGMGLKVNLSVLWFPHKSVYTRILGDL